MWGSGVCMLFEDVALWLWARCLLYVLRLVSHLLVAVKRTHLGFLSSLAAAIRIRCQWDLR